MFPTITRLRENLDSTAHCLKKEPGSACAAALRSGPMVILILMSRPILAQEALTDSMANDSAAAARNVQQQSSDYTYKNGDFKLLVVPSLNLEWNDNINLSKTNAEDDFVVTPTVGLVMSYPLTDRNLLQFNVTFGYTKYIKHDNLSSWYMQSGSGLSFDLYIKDILINLHDRFSYEQASAQDALQNSPQNAQIAGTGSYGTFQNTAGLSITLDFLKNMTTTLGYDHQNSISTSSQFDNTDQSSELLYARVGYMLNSRLTAGVEGSGSFTTYDQNNLTNSLNNNSSCSVGVYADWQPDSSFHLQPRVGYTFNLFQQTSHSVQTSDSGSWYADVKVSHQISKAITYSIDIGRESTLGVQSDLNEDWYVRPNFSWNFMEGYSFQTSLFYEHGNSGVGNVKGNVVESYDWYGGELNLSYSPMKEIRLSLNYRLTVRASSEALGEYTQNTVGLQVTYTPQ
jgi:hypothetical protein